MRVRPITTHVRSNILYVHSNMAQDQPIHLIRELTDQRASSRVSVHPPSDWRVRKEVRNVVSAVWSKLGQASGRWRAGFQELRPLSATTASRSDESSSYWKTVTNERMTGEMLGWPSVG